ncbi:oxidoreductase [Pseudomonas solani]|uniref:oxidoreductase n=1 Tax=Pseudomonas TaxID=286 RepID=UPI0021DFE1D6|nr:oxidoreductase [Pseudomonas sp. PDM13]MCU9950164.1 oxidoreductase [Pseudomonas sp. PDM13]
MPSKRQIFVTIFLTFALYSLARGEQSSYPLDIPALRLHLPGASPLVFTLRDLQAMPGVNLRARGPSDDKVSDWYGVPLSQFLQQLPANLQHPAELHLRALNDYSVVIPASDIERYQPVIAYSRDGQPMAVEAYGPLFLMYPFNAHAELRVQKYYNRAIWQLSDIYIE